MVSVDSVIERIAGEPEDEATEDVLEIIKGGIVGAIAGGIGTIAFSAVLYLAALLGAFDPAQFGELATLAGFGSTVIGIGSPLVGYLVFVAGGVTIWPLLFSVLNQYLPGWRMAVSGLSFAAIGWTGFAVAFYAGQTGLTLALYLGLTLVGQLAYGMIVGLVFEYAQGRVDVAFIDQTFP